MPKYVSSSLLCGGADVKQTKAKKAVKKRPKKLKKSVQAEDEPDVDSGSE